MTPQCDGVSVSGLSVNKRTRMSYFSAFQCECKSRHCEGVHYKPFYSTYTASLPPVAPCQSPWIYSLAPHPVSACGARGTTRRRGCPMPAGGKRVLGSSMIVSGFSTPHWYIYTVCEYIAKLNRHVYVSTCACTCACDSAYDCDC